MNDGIYKRLVDAFQEQDDVKKRELPEGSPAMPGTLTGWKVFVGEHLPPCTMFVSRDIFDALKKERV